MKVISSSIAAQVTFAFGCVLLVVVALGLISLNQLGAVNDRAADVRDNWLPSLHVNTQMTATLKEVRLKEARVLVAGNATELADAVSHLTAAQQDLKKARDAYQPMIVKGTDDEKFINQFDQGLVKWTQSVNHVVDLVRKGDPAAAAYYEKDDFALFDTVDRAVADDAAFNAASGKKAADEGETVYRATIYIVYGAVAVAALLAAFLGWSLIRNVSSPVKAMTGVMGRLAGHDLTAEITGRDRKDEIGAMAAAVQVFKDNMTSADQMAEAQKKRPGRQGRPCEKGQCAHLCLRHRYRQCRAVGFGPGDADGVFGPVAVLDRRGIDQAVGRRRRRLGRGFGQRPDGGERRPRNCPPRSPRSAARCPSHRGSPPVRSARPRRPTRWCREWPRPRRRSARWWP